MDKNNIVLELTPESEDFYSYLVAYKPLSLFVVVNENLHVEDIAVAPITEDMILNYFSKSIILFSEQDTAFEKFKDKHLKNLELPMPNKVFLRFDLKDTKNLPTFSLYRGKEYVQNVLIPLLFKEATYNQSFEEEYIRKEYKKVSQSSPEEFAENRYDFSVPAIIKYKDIPAETEKQISLFLFSNLKNTKVFFGKQNELEALHKTQYYKINHVDEDLNLTDDKLILPIDILIAQIKGDGEKAEFIHHLYLLQINKATFKDDIIVPSLMFRQLEIVLDYYRGIPPDAVRMSEVFIEGLAKLPEPVGTGQYAIMYSLLADYQKIAKCNEDTIRILQGEKSQNRYDEETVFGDIIIKQIKLLENVTKVTDQSKRRFTDLQNSLVYLDQNLPLNYNALALKIDELEKNFYPDREELCEIKLETKEEFYPLLRYHLANIISQESNLIEMTTDDDTCVNDNIKLLWKQYENLCACDPNSKIIFHTRFITNTDLMAIEPFLLDSFIRNYLDYLGFRDLVFLCVAEESGQHVEINIFIKNNTDGDTIFSEIERLLAKRVFYDCRWELRLPLYPIKDSNLIRKNLANHLSENPENNSKKSYPKI